MGKSKLMAALTFLPSLHVESVYLLSGCVQDCETAGVYMSSNDWVSEKVALNSTLSFERGQI